MLDVLTQGVTGRFFCAKKPQRRNNDSGRVVTSRTGNTNFAEQFVHICGVVNSSVWPSVDANRLNQIIPNRISFSASGHELVQGSTSRDSRISRPAPEIEFINNLSMVDQRALAKDRKFEKLDRHVNGKPSRVLISRNRTAPIKVFATIAGSWNAATIKRRVVTT